MTRLARMSQGICLNFKQRDKDQRGWQRLHPLMEPGSLVKISSLALLNSKSAILQC